MSNKTELPLENSTLFEQAADAVEVVEAVEEKAPQGKKATSNGEPQNFILSIEVVQKDIDKAVESSKLALPTTLEKAKSLKAEIETLTIASIDDRAGYKAVDEKRKAVRATRLAFQTKTKELNDLANKYKKDLADFAEPVIQTLQEAEDGAKDKLAIIDNIIEAKKLEAERKLREEQELLRKKQQEIESRRNQVSGLGFLYDLLNKRFIHPLIPDKRITDEKIESLTKDEWNGLLDRAKLAIEAAKPKPAPEPEIEETLESEALVEETPQEQPAHTAVASGEPKSITIPFAGRTQAMAVEQAAPLNIATDSPAKPQWKKDLQGVDPFIAYRTGFNAGVLAAIKVLEVERSCTRQQFVEMLKDLKPEE